MARILIAEPVRTPVARALNSDGHEVVTAAHGAEALDKLQSEGSLRLLSPPPSDFPKLPVLLMTGFADQRERASGLEALVSDVISKPLSVAEISFAVTAALTKGKR